MNINTLVLPKEEQTLHEVCNSQLKKIWSKKGFKEEFEEYFKYHLYKFREIIKTRAAREEFINELYTFISDLFYQGYYLGIEMSNHPEVKIEDQFLEQPNGLIKEQVFDILYGVTGDIDRVVTHQESTNFIYKVSTDYPDAEPLLKQLKIDATCFGCYHSLLNERENRKLVFKEESNSELNGYIFRTDDLFFVDPEKYLVCLTASKESEVWQLNTWAGIETRNPLLGEVILTCLDEESLNKCYQSLPYYQGREALTAISKKINMHILFKEKIKKYEQMNILSSIAKAVASRNNLDYEHIHITCASTDDVSHLKYNPDNDEK